MIFHSCRYDAPATVIKTLISAETVLSGHDHDHFSDGENRIAPQPAVHTVRGNRFQTQAHALMVRVNASVDFDKRLWRQDVAGSKAHAAMLAERGIIDESDNVALQRGLDRIAEAIESGQFAFSDELEDVHMNIESRLAALIGAPAGRLHTARSRNDQVALDFRLWVRDAIDRIDALLREYITALLDKAETHTATVMPGFTHLQPAQPVTFGHHLLAYAETALRDRGRFRDARKRLNESPLGAAALAGTGFPIDRDHTARALGFDRPTGNSIDSVSARDFALEFLSATAICAAHLSRLAEEIVLWSTPQFDFIALSDAWTTGSSIMPQKRNPDAAELVRGKTGRTFGNLTALLTVVKGLPLAYSKDLQEDKERVFDSADTIELCIGVSAAMIGDMQVNAPAMRAAAAGGFSLATDLADRITQRLNVPFRESHHLTGALVRLAETAGVPLHQIDPVAAAAIDPRLTVELWCDLSVENSVASRTSYGGTAPERVSERIAVLREAAR